MFLEMDALLGTEAAGDVSFEVRMREASMGKYLQ